MQEAPHWVRRPSGRLPPKAAKVTRRRRPAPLWQDRHGWVARHVRAASRQRAWCRPEGRRTQWPGATISRQLDLVAVGTTSAGPLC